MFERVSSSQYRHWNVSFEDILKLRLILMENLGDSLESGEEVLVKVDKEDLDFDNHEKLQNLVFSLCILYTDN